MPALSNGKETADALTDFVNYNRSNKEEFEAFIQTMCWKSHRTLQQSTMSLFLGLCKEWAEMKKSGRFDLRNQATCEMAEKIMALTEGFTEMPFI